MYNKQLDLLRDYLRNALLRDGVRGQPAFEIYCASNGIDPRIDCEETEAIRRLFSENWGG